MTNEQRENLTKLENIAAELEHIRGLFFLAGYQASPSEMWQLDKIAQILKECQDQAKANKENPKTAQEKAAAVLSTLSSAYQEEAIENTAELLSEYDSAQKFADYCCQEYREILKRAGFGGSAIYRGFRYYGDEIETQQAALEIYSILKGE